MLIKYFACAGYGAWIWVAFLEGQVQKLTHSQDQPSSLALGEAWVSVSARIDFVLYIYLMYLQILYHFSIYMYISFFVVSILPAHL